MIFIVFFFPFCWCNSASLRPNILVYLYICLLDFCICVFVHLLADGAGLWPSGPWITPHLQTHTQHPVQYTPHHIYLPSLTHTHRHHPERTHNTKYTFLHNTHFSSGKFPPTLVLPNITFSLHSPLQPPGLLDTWVLVVFLRSDSARSSSAV